MSPHLALRLCLLAVGCAVSCASVAATAPITAEWDMRLRHEAVADDAFALDADATTLRIRAGLRFHGNRGWSALLEGEAIAGAGGYNSGSNRRTALPLVADPNGIELNQAWVGWKGARGAATVGRQRLLFDNQRWLGNVGWRQNEQTFDALALEITPAKSLTLRYAWLDRVHRINGDDAVDLLARERALSTHMLNASLKRGAQQWTGYGYLHDDRDVAGASTATWGLRWTGTRQLHAATLGWTLEVARQRDHAGNPRRFSHAYWLVEPSVALRGVTARVGWEHLGGDGAHALQTPLATLHAFNGWADKFLSTPAGGLEDRYLGLGGAFGGERAGARPAWQVAWHDYRADRGGRRYGREWNASLSVPVATGTTAMLKWADYRAEGFARDTRKLWLQVEYKGRR